MKDLDLAIDACIDFISGRIKWINYFDTFCIYKEFKLKAAINS